MDGESNTSAADKQRPGRDGRLPVQDDKGKWRYFNLDPSDYGYYAPNLDDATLVQWIIEEKDRTIRYLFDTAEARADNPTFEELHLPVTAEPIERQPCILERSDGAAILYAGRFSTLHGEPGCGKSWVALIAAGKAIERGGRCLWMDCEDRPGTVATRAGPLGLLESVTNTDRFRFYNAPELIESNAIKGEALGWLLTAPAPRFSLVVIDSAETWGGGGHASDDVNPWLDKAVDPWRKADVAVLLVDHIPKREKDRPAGPIGSQTKRARVDGAALRVEGGRPYLDRNRQLRFTGGPWTKTKGGHVTLLNEKDRIGDLEAGMGRPIATLAGSWDASGGFAWELAAPKVEADTGTEAEAGDMETVYEAIKAAGLEGIRGITAVQEAAGIRRFKVIEAVRGLVEAGRIEKEKQGRGWVYRVDGGGLTQEEKAEVQAAIDYGD